MTGSFVLVFDLVEGERDDEGCFPNCIECRVMRKSDVKSGVVFVLRTNPNAASSNGFKTTRGISCEIVRACCGIEKEVLRGDS